MEKINIEFSDEDSIIKSSPQATTRTIYKFKGTEKQNSTNGSGGAVTPQLESFISNPIFERVFMNDLPGLKKTVEAL